MSSINDSLCHCHDHETEGCHTFKIIEGKPYCPRCGKEWKPKANQDKREDPTI